MIKNIVSVESNIIGALIRKEELYDDISSMITKNDFSGHFTGELFEIISDMVGRGDKADIITISTEYQKKTSRDQLAEIGLLAKNTTGSGSIKHYANLIKQNSTELALLNIGQEIIEISNNASSTSEKINEAQNKIMGLSEKIIKTGLTPAKSIIKEFINDMEERSLNGGAISGLETGFSDLDEITGGLQTGDLVVLAGRPSMGKTTLAMNITEYVTTKNTGGDQILVYSLEMSAKKLMERSVASLGRINHKNIKSAKLSETEWNYFTPAVVKIMESKLLIDETPQMSIGEIRSKTRKAMRKGEIALIVIDYLQLMDYGDDKELQALTKITPSLKAMAKEAHCPVIALSQLSRAVEQRPNKRPIMSDLRGSGTIEQDADIIIFMYRDEYYNENSAYAGLAEMIIAKHRDGETGTVTLKSRLDQMRFENHSAGLPEQKYKKDEFDY